MPTHLTSSLGLLETVHSAHNDCEGQRLVVDWERAPVSHLNPEDMGWDEG